MFRSSILQRDGLEAGYLMEPFHMAIGPGIAVLTFNPGEPS